MNRLGIIVIACFVADVFGVDMCFNNTVQLRDKCLMFTTEQYNWKESQAVCESQGGSLATPTSSYDDGKIKQFIKDKRDLCFWTDIRKKVTRYNRFGVVNKGAKGYYFTSTNATVEDQFWNPGEPNNPRREQCVNYKVLVDSIGWNDERCTSRCYPICQTVECPKKCAEKKHRDIPLCNNGALKLGNNCFFHARNLRYNWTEAREYCLSKGAKLTKVEQEENRQLVAFLSPQPFIEGFSFWTDATRDWKEFKYADWNVTMNYTQWAWGEPNNAGRLCRTQQCQENCVSAILDKQALHLNDDECAHKHEFFCETNDIPTTTYRIPIVTSQTIPITSQTTVMMSQSTSPKKAMDASTTTQAANTTNAESSASVTEPMVLLDIILLLLLGL